MTTHKLTLRPDNQAIEVDSTKTLLQSLKENDVYIKSSCGGVATCSDCICKIVSGEDNLVSPGFSELKLLGNVFHITKERLLCQTKIVGDVTIDISRHNKATDEEKLKQKTSQFSKTKNASKNIKVKKNSQVELEQKIKNEVREKEFAENENKDKTWEKHWEKDKSGAPKKLSGGKRPKYFNSDKVVERPEKSESPNTNQNEMTQKTDFKKFRN